MTQKFVSFERLRQYDNLIKQFINSIIATEDVEAILSAIEVLNGTGDGSVQKQITDAFDDFATKVSNDNVVNSYKELVDYVAAHGPEFATLVGNVETLQNAVGTKATETTAATGLYKALEDATSNLSSKVINATSGEGEIVATLGGTVGNPTISLDYEFCSADDVSSLFDALTAVNQLLRNIQYVKNGGTVKIYEDVDLGATSLTIDEGKEFTLDLNGHDIISSNAAIFNKGNLTIKSSKDGGLVKGKFGVYNGDNATVTIESGDFESSEFAVATGVHTGGTVTINGGNFTTTDNAIIGCNGTERTGEANTITINGGTFNGGITSSGYIACGIYAPWKDNIVVTGGTFNITNGCGICQRAGNVTVTGGEFNCTGDVTGWVGDSKNTVPCSAIVYDSNANYPAQTDESKITISGGSFTSDVDSVTLIKDALDTNNRIEISGGTFSSDVTEFNVA